MNSDNHIPKNVTSTDAIETSPSQITGPSLTPTVGLAKPPIERDLYAEKNLEKAPERRQPAKVRPITLGRPVPSEARRGQSSTYFARQMSMGYNISQSGSQSIIISVQPRMTDWILPFSNFVSHQFSTTKFERFDKVSPQTLMAYFYYVGIARLLLFDLRSPVPSKYALEVQDNQAMYNFVLQLQDLVIPQDLADIFENISPASLAEPLKVRFVPSLAGFSHNQDFSKFIHPAAFLKMHNGIATGGITKTEELNLLRTKLYTAGARTIRLGNFFSKFFLKDGTWFESLHWLSQRISGLTVPYTSRYNLRRPQFATISVAVPQWDRHTSNPYIFLLSLTEPELTTTHGWVSQLNEYVGTELGDTIYVAQTMDDSHNGILHHYISPALLPGSTITSLGFTDTPITATTTEVDANFSRYVQEINFGVPFTHGPGQNAVLNPSATQATLNLYYGSGSTTEPKTQSREFRYDDDYNGDVMCFSPSMDTVLSHHRTLLSGIMIENGNIDGISLPLPNHLEHLMNWNTRLLNVMIRADRVTHSPTQGRTLFDRPVDTYLVGSSSILLFDQKKNRIVKTNSTYTGQHPHQSYFTIEDSWNGSTPPITVLSSVAQTHTTDLVKADLWSSYRYVLPGKKGAEHVYMIPSLYAFFGLAAVTVKMEQLFKILPT